MDAFVHAWVSLIITDFFLALHALEEEHAARRVLRRIVGVRRDVIVTRSGRLYRISELGTTLRYLCDYAEHQLPTIDRRDMSHVVTCDWYVPEVRGVIMGVTRSTDRGKLEE